LAYYKKLEAKFYKIPQVPKNDEGPSTSYIDLANLAFTYAIETPAILDISNIKNMIQDNRCDDYIMKRNAFFVGELPQSPRSHGQPQSTETPICTLREDPCRFRH